MINEWIDYIDGESGLSIRTKINAFNTSVNTNLDNVIVEQQREKASSEITYDNTISGLTATDVKLAIDEVKSEFDNFVVDSTDVIVDPTDTALAPTDTNAELAFNKLSKVGLVVMSGNDLTPQTIELTDTKVVLYDTLLVQEGVGITADLANNKSTVTLDGVFKIRFEAFVSYASNVDITWKIYKNGTPTTNSITLTGQGATIFQIVLITSSTFSVDDYLELFAVASAQTDITLSLTNGTIEKTIF